jgi:hypothetical protein
MGETVLLRLHPETQSHPHIRKYRNKAAMCNRISKSSKKQSWIFAEPVRHRPPAVRGSVWSGPAELLR